MVSTVFAQSTCSETVAVVITFGSTKGSFLEVPGVDCLIPTSARGSCPRSLPHLLILLLVYRRVESVISF